VADGLYDRATLLTRMGAWQCDLATERLTWTAGVFDLFGLPHDNEICRGDTVAMYAEDSREEMERLRADAIACHRGFSMDARIVRADGTIRWMRLTADVVVRQGQAVQLYGMKQDITEEYLRWEAIRRMAEQDALTGLASRGLFQTRFLNASSTAPGIVPLGALVLFDVDGFKQVNDRWGHVAGDACLAAVARRLTLGFPKALMIARIGGDEFAVLLPAGTAPHALKRLIEKQIAHLSGPIFWQGKLLKVTASAGVATPPSPMIYDAGAMFAAADKALYGAKQAGRDRVQTAPAC